jgi:hypothetical protein
MPPKELSSVIEAEATPDTDDTEARKKVNRSISEEIKQLNASPTISTDMGEEYGRVGRNLRLRFERGPLTACSEGCHARLRKITF